MATLLTMLILIMLLCAAYARAAKAFPWFARIVDLTFRQLRSLASHGRNDGFKDRMQFFLVENARVSPGRFYQLFEMAMRRRIGNLALPMRVTRREGSVWAPRRECLRLIHGGLAIDVCAAPYGRQFYVSWRVRRAHIPWRSWVLVLPAVCQIARRNRAGDHEQDDQFLFEESVRRALEDVITQVTPGQTAVLPGHVQRPVVQTKSHP